MTVLSDVDILKGEVGIYPLDKSMIQPASVDLCLASKFIEANAVDPDYQTCIDLDAVSDTNNMTEVIEAGKFYLQPQQFILASTVERVSLPNFIVGRVEGKSSLGRLGLLIHATAGFIDPGFTGNITLEISNLNCVPIILRAGLPICQISFQYLESLAINPYGSENLNSKYQNQSGTTESRYDG